MILGTMSEKEILKEFWTDYEEIQRRCFGFVKGKSHDLFKIQKSQPQSYTKPDWWWTFKDLKNYKIRGNQYRVVLRGKLDKKKYPSIKITTYLIFNNFSSGKKQVILLPANERANNLIILDTKFFTDYKKIFDLDGWSFEDIVQHFMTVNLKFTVYTDEGIEDFFNTEVDLTVGIGLGHGKVEEGGYNKFELFHMITDEKHVKMNEEMGTLITDPLKTWLTYRDKDKNREEEEIKETLTQKEKEIMDAWNGVIVDEETLEKRRQEELNSIFAELENYDDY